MATEAERRAVAAYQKRQDNIMVRPSKDDGYKIRQAALLSGKSVQRFILDVVLEYIDVNDLLKTE